MQINSMEMEKLKEKTNSQEEKRDQPANQVTIRSNKTKRAARAKHLTV